MARVLSIEVGSGVTRVLETDYKVKKPKVYHYFEFETPKDMEADGSVKINESFYGLLRAGLKEHKIKTEKVMFTVNSGRIAVREIMVPMVKEQKLKTMVMANISEYFPVDLSMYELGIRIMDRIENQEGKQYKVALTAMPIEIINSYRSLAAGMGMTLVGIDYVGNSLIQAVKREKQAGTTVYIKVDEDSSLVVILEEANVVLQRTISYGIGEAVAALLRTGNFGDRLSYIDTVNVLRKNPCIRRTLEQEEEYQGEGNGGWKENAVTEALRPVISNVSRILDYYISRNEGKEIKHVFLTGLGAEFCGFDALMSSELGLKVVPAKELAKGEVSKELEEVFPAAEYAAGIGAVIAPLFGEEIRSGQEANAAGVKDSRESLMLAGIVCGVCGIAAVAMIIWSVASGVRLKGEQRELERKVKELAYAQETYDKYEKVRSEYGDVKEMEKMTETKNTHLSVFFQEMEEKIPKGTYLRVLNTDGVNLSMEFQTSKKEEAAKIIMQLRTFTTLQSVATSEIREEKDEQGVVLIKFTATAVYAGVSEEKEAKEEQAEPDGAEEEKPEPETSETGTEGE